MKENRFPSREYQTIESLRSYFNASPSVRYPLVAGDDAAVRVCFDNERLVMTADTAVQDVHFSLEYMSLAEIGFRAMVSNVSDCAAMGALPESALVQVVFQDSCADKESYLRDLYKGINKACTKWDFSIVGGDLAQGPCWTIAITMIGRVPVGCVELRRSHAHVGDVVWVTSYPGESRAGLATMQRWGRRKVPYKYSGLVRKHVAPDAHVAASVQLAGCSQVHAAIDISDGVSKECHTIAYDSSCGIELTPESFPRRQSILELAEEMGTDWNDWFLHGGEDYDLLITSAPEFDPNSVLTGPVPLFTRIGRCVSGPPGVWLTLEGGGRTEVPRKGWDHFSPRP